MSSADSIRNQLITAFAGFAIVPLFLLGAVFVWQSFIIQKEQVFMLQKEFSVQAAQGLSCFSHEQEQKVRELVNGNPLVDISVDQLTSILSKFIFTAKNRDHGHLFNECSVINKDGLEITRVSRQHLVVAEDLQDRSKSEEFTGPARNGSNYYGPIHFDKSTGEPVMKMSVPIKDLRTLAFQGVLVVKINFRPMWKLVENMTIGKTGMIFLTDHTGKIFVHSNPSVVLSGTNFEIAEEPSIMMGHQGKMAVVASEKVSFGGSPIFAVTEVPVSEAFSHLNRMVLTIVTFLALTLAAAIAVGLYSVRRIVSPIDSLVVATRQMNLGDLSPQMPSGKMAAELQELADAFNAMTLRLVGTIKDLEQERNFVRAAIDSLTHPFYVIDVKDYTIKLANSAANFGEITGNQTCYSLTHHSDKPCEGSDHPCSVREILKTGKTFMAEHIHYVDNSTPKTFEVYGYPVFNDQGELIQVIEYNIEITDKKNLEEQLRQAQKLEALGSLAGGVAHDFNNLLTAIIGYSQLMLMKLPEGSETREAIEVIAEAGEKAASLTQQLLAFSRKQILEIKVVNLNSVIDRMAKILNRVIGEDISLKLKKGNGLWNIKADLGQMDQVLVNLSVNARDAMVDGGRVEIETSNIVLDEAAAQKLDNIKSGAYVLLTVTDYGEGIDHEVKEKIFDPFFSTKGRQGTGLGLATVYGIVKQHGGHIFVESEPGLQTVFCVYFPATEECVQEISEQNASLSGGGETILVVDDEPGILRMVRDALGSLGYREITASSGEDALELCAATEEKIDILLTDVVMKGMNGRQLANSVEGKYPDIQVIFMSGYTYDIIARRGVIDEGMNFIQKPLRPATLSKIIREVLEDSGS